MILVILFLKRPAFFQCSIASVSSSAAIKLQIAIRWQVLVFFHFSPDFSAFPHRPSPTQDVWQTSASCCASLTKLRETVVNFIWISNASAAAFLVTPTPVTSCSLRLASVDEWNAVNTRKAGSSSFDFSPTHTYNSPTVPYFSHQLIMALGNHFLLH